jgi:hypothetical protein
VFRIFWFLLQYLVFRNHFVVLVKRQLAHQKRVEDDTQTPNVHLFTRILLAFQHLRRAVTDSSTPCLQVVRLALVLARKTKVDQLDITVFVQQYVFEFEVAVDAGLVMDVGYSADELGEDLLDSGGFEGALG